MSDEIDRAQNEVERSLTEAMRKRRPAGPVANGRCHYCGELIDDEARWCDIGCREGWERENKRKARA